MYFKVCERIEYPSQLSEEETLKYFELYNGGSKEAFNKLVEHNLRLVIYIASQYKHENIEPEDMIGVGNMGLTKAVMKFDVSKGYKFATFATRCINNEILMLFRKYKRPSNMDISLDEIVYIASDGGTTKLLDILPDASPKVDYLYECEETHNELIEAIGKLNERERKIVVGKYGWNSEMLSNKELADELNLTISSVSKIRQKACLKMLRYITLKYNDNIIVEDKIESHDSLTRVFQKTK